MSSLAVAALLAQPECAGCFALEQLLGGEVADKGAALTDDTGDF